MTGGKLTRKQTLERTSEEVAKLVKKWDLNMSDISITIKNILDISESKWGLTEEELIKEIDSLKN